METPVRRDGGCEEAGVWSESPLVFTSPGGNVSTKGRSRVKSDTAEFTDENFQSKMSVSIPTSQLMPPPRLRSSCVTPLKPSNRLGTQNPLFSFSPCKKTPSRPPMSGKKPRGKSAARLRDEEREVRRVAARKKQEKLYVSWLNLTLDTPRKGVYIPQIRCPDVGREQESAWLSSTFESGREQPPSKLSSGASVGRGARKQLIRTPVGTGREERLTPDFGALQSTFTLLPLRQRLRMYFDPACEEEIIAEMLLVAKRIDDGKLRMKEGCAVLADVGLKKQTVDVLMCYSSAWLKLGLYVVLGDEAEDSNMQDTLEKRFFCHAGVAKEYATNRTVEGLYRQGYLEALGRVILKRLLLLVLVLDKLKCQTALVDGTGIDGLDGGSVLLFRKSAVVKSSSQALQVILKNAMHGEGDVIAHLNVLGYRLHHVQDWLPDYNFRTSSLRDLSDGLRLCRLAQVMTLETSILKKLHSPTNSKKRQRQHCEAALEAFERGNVSLLDEQGFTVCADSILSGDPDVLLCLLWNVLLQLQIPLVLNKLTVLQEVFRIESISGVAEAVSPDCTSISAQDILLRWTKVVCLRFGFEVQSFNTSFSDGQALCYLVSFYLPEFLPPEKIQSSSKDTATNFELLHTVTRKLGFLDEVLDHCKNPEESYWNERNMVLLVGLLCSKLVCTNFEDLLDELQLQDSKLEDAAITIQAHFRGWKKRKRYSQMRSSKGKIVAAWRTYRARQDMLKKKSAVKKLQFEWRKYVLAKRERETAVKHNAARVLQTWFRGFMQRRSFKRMIQSAVKIQAAWRCFARRKQYTSAKASVRKMEAWWLTVVQTRKYRELRHAAVVVQAYYRCWSLRRLYIKVLDGVRKLQALWRGRVDRRFYSLQKTCVLRIQRRWRQKIRDKNCRATKIQAVWRGCSSRRWLSKQRKAAIVLQSYHRSFAYRKSFLSYRKDVILIQALARGKLARKEYQRNIAARELQASQHALEKKTEAAMSIQAAYRFWRERQAEVSRLQKADHNVLNENQQTRQAHAFLDRNGKEKKHLAALAIQRHFRGWRTRKLFTVMRRSACLIQASWKGYVIRKQCQNEEVMALRLRMQNTASTADCNMTLGNRLNQALALLLSFKTVSSILHVCATIDVATEHSSSCCERIAEGGGIIKILQLIQTTNRSTPHEQVLKHALSILGHLAGYPVLARSIVHTKGSLIVITEQLQMNRNKEEIFFKAMRVLQLVCRESPEHVVRTSPIVLRRLQHIKQLLEKKVETERRAVERLPSSANSASRTSAEKKLAEARAQVQSVAGMIKALTASQTLVDPKERRVARGSTSQRK